MVTFDRGCRSPYSSIYLHNLLQLSRCLEVYIPHLSATEAARGADERKSLKKLKTNNDCYFLLENPFDMVNRRDIVFSCWCYIIVRSISLDLVCCVWLKLYVYAHACVCGILVRTSVFVCVRVVIAYNYFFAFFIQEIYFGSRHQTLSVISHSIIDVEVVSTHLSQDDHSNEYYISCLCHLPTLVYAYLPHQCVTYTL